MMNIRSARVGLLLLGIVAVFALSATAASGDNQHEKPTSKDEKPKHEKPPEGPTGATGPTGQVAPTEQSVPAPAAPAPAAPAPLPVAAPAPAGEAGAQGGGDVGGGGVSPGGGERVVAQVTPEQQPAAAGEEAAPTELAKTGSNLVGLALIAVLCLVGAALAFPKKSGKRAVR